MKMLGIIFSNIYDDFLGELTKNRTLASIPFGGRYRLIDFILSNYVNSGITKVGVITKSNYLSLMDHVGKGKEWDLDRKKGGLYILPPFGAGEKNLYRGKNEALYGVKGFIQDATQKYVVLSDCNMVYSLDCQAVLENHIASGADITMVTKKVEIRNKLDMQSVVVKTDKTNTVKDVIINYNTPGVVQAGFGVYILERKLLLDLVDEAMSYNNVSFDRDIIQLKHKELHINNYEHKGVTLSMTSISDYFNSNMKLLDKPIRDELFRKNIVHTKAKDEMPTLFGYDASIANSYLADGCIIDGTVENSILFRGVKIEKGAVVRNCILMQNTTVSEDASLDFTITDKNVTIKSRQALKGVKEYPVIISKGSVV